MRSAVVCARRTSCGSTGCGSSCSSGLGGLISGGTMAGMDGVTTQGTACSLSSASIGARSPDATCGVRSEISDSCVSCFSSSQGAQMSPWSTSAAGKTGGSGTVVSASLAPASAVSHGAGSATCLSGAGSGVASSGGAACGGSGGIGSAAAARCAICVRSSPRLADTSVRVRTETDFVAVSAA